MRFGRNWPRLTGCKSITVTQSESLMMMSLFSGNGLIIASTCSVILGLTFGGVRWPWSSPRVIAPIVLGIVGLGLSLLYEFNVPSHPTASNIPPSHTLIDTISLDPKGYIVKSYHLRRVGRVNQTCTNLANTTKVSRDLFAKHGHVLCNLYVLATFLPANPSNVILVYL